VTDTEGQRNSTLTSEPARLDRPVGTSGEQDTSRNPTLTSNPKFTSDAEPNVADVQGENRIPSLVRMDIQPTDVRTSSNMSEGVNQKSDVTDTQKENRMMNEKTLDLQAATGDVTRGTTADMVIMPQV